MPWRLILLIFVFVVFMIFMSFNLDDRYRSDINFGFKQAENIPVFLTVFVSFTLGLISSLPLLIKQKKKQNTSVPQNVLPIEPAAEYKPDEKIKQEAASAKQKFLARRRGGNAT